MAGAKKVILYAIYLVVSSALLLEVALFFLESQYPPPSFESISVTSFGSTYCLSENRKLGYVPVANSGRFNSYGHLGPAYPRKKKEGLQRIVFVGDSVTEGIGVAENKRFTALLEQFMSPKYEVINLAVRGYNFLQSAEYLKEVGLSFSPDIVIFGITFNDLFSDSGELKDLANKVLQSKQSTFYWAYYGTKGGVERYLLYSRLYRHLKFIWHKLTSKPTPNPESTKEAFSTFADKLKIDDVRAVVRDLEDVAKKGGFRLVYLFLPFRAPELDKDLLKREIVARGGSCIDLHEKAKKELNAEEYDELFRLADPCHFLVSGHLWVAKQLEKEL